MHQLSALTRYAPRQNSLDLGLFIARNIVLGHGGMLEVESSVADGTVFTAVLPRCA